MLQILHGNTAMMNLRHLSKLSFTASAYCQARGKIPLAVCQRLLNGLTQSGKEAGVESECWRGHRLYYVDGSSFSMPDTEALQAHFGQPGGQQPGCGFPVAHFLALSEAATGLITEVLTAPLRTHDMWGMVEVHPQLQAADVLVADRGFCSFAHLALLARRGVQMVVRVHQRQIVNFTPHRAHAKPGANPHRHKGWPRSRWIEALGDQDQVVEWRKPRQRPRWLSVEQFAALPETLKVRELRYQSSCPGFRTEQITLVTTLVDAQRYPADELARVYFRRWRIETHLRHLKITLGMDVLKCETVDGVLKEVAMFVLVYNLVRLVMLEAAQRQQVDLERISFIDALRGLINARPGEPLIPLIVNPERPYRYEPRVKKRRPKNYKLMNQPRQVLKQQLAA